MISCCKTKQHLVVTCMYTVQKEWPSFVHPLVALFVSYYYSAFINGRGVTPFNWGAAELLMLLSSLDKCTYIWIWMDRYSRDVSMLSL